jgi:cytoskeleton protein RodZ
VNEAVEAPPLAEYPAAGPGAMLARERTERGLSVAEIAAQLRYSTKQIEALESDDYARLPGTTFVRGMIRGYAKILGAKAEPILQALERRHIPAPVTVDLRARRVPFPDGKARSTRVYVWLCVAIGAVVAAVVYEWNFDLPQPFGANVAVVQPETAKVQVVEKPAGAAENPVSSGEKVTEPAAVFPPGSQSPGAQPLGEPIPVAGGASRLRFDFKKEAWVEVKDRDGKTLTAQINPAGTQVVVDGNPPFALVIGNAPFVQLMYGEKPVDLTQHIKSDVARLTLN